MRKRHPDAAIVDRLGRARIRQHFGISDAAISYWRREGIPDMHRKTLQMIADRDGIEL